MRLEMDSLSENEEFARVVVAVFLSRLNPTLEEIDDVKTAVSEAVTNAVIHGYGEAWERSGSWRPRRTGSLRWRSATGEPESPM